VRRLVLIGGLLAAGLYVWSRTQRGQVAAVDAVEFVDVTAQRIADDIWRVTVGLRNRNPGNIDFISNPLKRWRGMKSQPGEGGRFAEFDSDANGVRAIARELKLEEGRGARTVAQQIEVWAPPAENNTAAYAKAVAKALGVNVNDVIRLNDHLAGFVGAIIKHENGVQPYSAEELETWVNA